MRRIYRRLSQVLLISLALILLAGCSIESNNEQAVVKFDGEVAQYRGPEQQPAGEMRVLLENSSDYDLDVMILMLEDGKTWQDMLDHIGAPGSKVPPPSWVESMTSMGVPNEPDATSFMLVEGSYAIILCRCNEILDYQVWPVAPLEVGSQ